MKGRAALLLLAVTFVLAEGSTVSPVQDKATVSTARANKTTPESAGIKTATSPTTTILSDVFPKNSEFGLPLTNPKDILLQEIRSLDEDASTNKIQEELAKAIKAEAQKSRDKPRPSTLKSRAKLITPTPNAIDKVNSELDKDEIAAMKALKRAEALDDDSTEDDEDDDDDEDVDDDDPEDEYEDDDDDDDDDEDDIADEEEVMTECPDYCRCAGQYAAATTARCSKLIDKQNFGPQIAHLRIENAGEIALGPQALRARGLQQLETITITDTRIAYLDKSAFNGTDYLFSVNLSRTALIDIEPDCFVNNTQLMLLTISGQPLGRGWISKKEYILNAPSVTELDFSSNGISHLPRGAFSKMPNLAYLDLKNNKLRSIENSTFEPVDSLVELDLSGNMLVDIPSLVVAGEGLQTLRISSNNLTRLNLQGFTKLTALDASNNRIRVITKDDLVSAPALESLIVSNNGIKRIHQHAFSILDQLNYLDISNNKLTNLTEHHLRANPRLQIILMNNNPDLGTLPVFKTIGIEYEVYSVWRFECSNCGLTTLSEGTFDSMPALTKLSLSKNRLAGLPANLLYNLSALHELDLSDNVISTLQPNMFAGAATLGKINLAGNPLVTLQVTPFLHNPGLSKLDVSRCQLKRIWSEARTPLKSLRFLSVRSNQLGHISLEELRAMPGISGLDANDNPFVCDDEFNQAIQWLITHNVMPTESLKYISNYRNSDDYAEGDNINRWTELANIICNNEEDGPPSRDFKHKPIDDLPILTLPNDDNTHNDGDRRYGLPDLEFINRQPIDGKFDDIFKEEYHEYEDSIKEDEEDSDIVTETRTWFSSSDTIGWRVIIVILSIMLIVVAACQLASLMAKRRGRGPVIRPPMILRQGLVDNKNCGLVYKPLQEEIATPHMPKRGSFYSSSTFHYDKIVPESV